MRNHKSFKLNWHKMEMKLNRSCNDIKTTNTDTFMATADTPDKDTETQKHVRRTELPMTKSMYAYIYLYMHNI